MLQNMFCSRSTVYTKGTILCNECNFSHFGQGGKHEFDFDIKLIAFQTDVYR
jgi:hypothetical protein